MKDEYERVIDYMRISVTDRCNLRCVYCMPEEGIPCLKHEDILTFEEIIRIAKAAAGLGIQKIKITGGEPLVRKGILNLIGSIKRIEGIQQVTLTTNGVLLEEMAEQLKQIGIDGINVSLSAVNPEEYKKITRRDTFSAVIKGIKRAVELGIRVKINCVPMKGFLEQDVVKLAKLAKQYPIDVRFIEMMPIGYGAHYEPIHNDEILHRLEAKYGSAYPSDKKGNGPAVYYDLEGFLGSIGFISAVSHEFCQSCNRIRLTAQGEVKACLHDGRSISLREALRSGISDRQLIELMYQAIYKKPARHNFNKETKDCMEQRKMVQIGG